MKTTETVNTIKQIEVNDKWKEMMIPTRETQRIPVPVKQERQEEKETKTIHDEASWNNHDIFDL